jgi:hypothetical protein
MAGKRFAFNVQRTVSLTTDDTIFQIRPATNQRVLLERLIIMGKSNTAGDTPVEFQLIRQTSDGTAAGAVTPRKIDNDIGSSLNLTVEQGDYSAEPTDSGDVPFRLYVHPQSRLELTFPFGREFVIGSGERLGLKTIQPAQASDFVFQVEGVE